jgi:hypothetical protein
MERRSRREYRGEVGEKNIYWTRRVSAYAVEELRRNRWTKRKEAMGGWI